jgi:penicillin amidase
MKKIVIGTACVLAVLFLSIYFYLHSFVANYNAALTSPTLKGRVTVERNRFAMPTITAENEEDLYFAWGYVNAQDRLFQMEITRRAAQGRLSEFAGESQFKKDVFLRAVGFYEIAKKEVGMISPAVRTRLQRYVDGINFHIDNDKTPLYNKLIGFKKEKWTVADAMAVGMMLNWSLAYNMKHELLNWRMARKLGRERAAELFNLLPSDTPTIKESRSSRDADARMIAFLRDLGSLAGSRSASNSWVLAPDRTSGGGAILANDPHVHDSHYPSDFYILRAKCPGIDVTGAQVAGVPLIVIGYNQNIAWGLTNNGADMVDLFTENVNFDKKTYQFQGKHYKLGEKKIVIGIKGKGDREVTLLYAGRRPLLHQVFDDPDTTFSLDWSGFDKVDISGYMLLTTAKSHADYLNAAKKIRMTPQNVVFADRSGTIAWGIFGSLPRRVKGTGTFPADGTKVKRTWEGNVTDAEYPSLKNPPRGYIITANNKNIKNSAFEMNGTYAPRYRYLAIERMLQMKKEHSLEDIKRMQNDTHSVLAQKVQGMIETHVSAGTDARLAAAREMVLRWDGRADGDSAACSIYNTFLVRFMFRTFADELGEELAAEYVGQRYISLERFFSLVEKKSAFFDNTATPKKETIADTATAAFREALDILEKYTGSSDMNAWKWNRVHVIRFDHPLGASKLLRRFVSHGPLPMDGDGETNRRAGFLEVTPPFVTHIAAGMRLAVQFNPEPEGHIMLITGANEYFMGPHDTDMVDGWMAGNYFSVEKEPVKYRMVMSPK